jgi:hypothetical protein
MRPSIFHLLAALGCCLAIGCGGGGGGTTAGTAPVTPPAPSSTYATTLVYSNPALSGYSLQADPASNGTGHLVLNLVGPAGTAAQGVSFFLTADPASVTWSKAGWSTYLLPGSVFDLGTAPQALAAGLLPDGGLQAGLYQKSGTAAFGSAPLASVALDLVPDAVTPGTTVSLAPTAGQQAVYLDGQGQVQPLPAAIGIGTLVAR